MTVKQYDTLTVTDASVKSVYFVTTRGLRYLKGHTALCEIPFMARFYSKDFILEMFSRRYVNIFVFFFLCVYWFNGLLFLPVILFFLYGDFINFVPSYSTMAKTSYNTVR